MNKKETKTIFQSYSSHSWKSKLVGKENVRERKKSRMFPGRVLAGWRMSMTLNTTQKAEGRRIIQLESVRYLRVIQMFYV